MRGESGVGTDAAAGRRIDVLHVDDEEHFAEMAAEHLQLESEWLAVETAGGAEEGLARLAEGSFDCVVSDYEMPGTDGLEFLEAVREAHDDLPFILFTGKGSEAIASRAISAGVTDYLQKGGGADQYAVLANRIENAADGYRSRSALECSQERLSLLVDQSTLGIVEWNTDFEVRSMNPAAEEILGYDEAELRGRSWDAIVSESDQATVAETADGLLAGEGGLRSVNENVRADGERIICEWHNRAVRDDHGEVVGVFSQFQDVTEREESQRRLETLVSNLPGMVYRCRNEPEWPMEFVGGECEELTGYAASTVEAGDVLWGEDILHAEDSERVWTTVQEALDEGEPFEVEYRIVTADDEVRWMWERGRGVHDGSGNLVALEGFITDVTDRVEHEAELSETNAVLSALLENLPVGVLVEDSDRDIVAVNSALTDLLGIDRGVDDLRGSDCRRALESVAGTFADPDRFDRRTEETLARREAVDAETFALSDGRVVERSYMPYEMPEGTANLWLYRDVTEREERETMLRQRERDLEQENERLDAFASIISHDLRNPLNVATGRLELARDEHDCEDLAEVAAALDRMQSLVDDLLALSREGKSIDETEPVEVELVAKRSVDTVEMNGGEVTIDAPVTVEADRGRLAQIFENLFRNAVEHGDEAVTVEVGATGEGFYVADDGPGIDPEERHRVFEAGYSTSDEGSGLGLSIVRDIVDAHGWTISVEESAAGGARFEITTDAE